jgi:hypothetical protein
VTRLVLVSNTALSPDAVWSFGVTTTLPCASILRIEEPPLIGGIVCSAPPGDREFVAAYASFREA